MCQCKYFKIHEFAKNKKHFSNEGSVLIDDLAKNISEWNENGGQGILHLDTDYQKTLDFIIN